MKYRIRTLVPIISFAFLVVFFLPFVHFTMPCYGSSFPSCNGYESIGWALTGWGAYTIANTAIYLPPAIALSSSYQFAAVGELLFVGFSILLIGFAFLFSELKDWREHLGMLGWPQLNPMMIILINALLSEY